MALTEVETVINELKTASRRREEESRRTSEEVRGLKELIPRAMEGQKESTDNRLKELNVELKSLKTLMGQRLNPSPTSVNPYSRVQSSGPASTPLASSTPINSEPSNEGIAPRPASVSGGVGTESVASLQGRSSSPFGTGAPPARAAIPSWQLAANKSTTPVNHPSTPNGTQEAGTQEASGSA